VCFKNCLPTTKRVYKDEQEIEFFWTKIQIFILSNHYIILHAWTVIPLTLDCIHTETNDLSPKIIITNIYSNDFFHLKNRVENVGFTSRRFQNN